MILLRDENLFCKVVTRFCSASHKDMATSSHCMCNLYYSLI